MNELGKDVEAIVDFQKTNVWLLISTMFACGLINKSDDIRQCSGADTDKEIFDLHKHAWS